MLNIKPVVGAMLLTLGLGLATPVSTYATTSPSATVAVSRPTEADLRAAISKLQSVGKYQQYFTAGVTKLTSSVEGYQEYNYLHAVVMTLQLVLPEYNSYTNEELSELIQAANDAYLGSRLKLGIVREESAAKKETQASQSVASTTKPAATQTTASTKPATSNTAASTTTLPTASSAQTSSAQVADVTVQATVEAAPATSNTEIVTDETAASVSATVETNQDDADVEVPATGEVETPVSFNVIALLAGLIAGAAILSILLTVIIRHEPQHNKGRRF